MMMRLAQVSRRDKLGGGVKRVIRNKGRRLLLVGSFIYVFSKDAHKNNAEYMYIGQADQAMYTPGAEHTQAQAQAQAQALSEL